MRIQVDELESPPLPITASTVSGGINFNIGLRVVVAPIATTQKVVFAQGAFCVLQQPFRNAVFVIDVGTTTIGR